MIGILAAIAVVFAGLTLSEARHGIFLARAGGATGLGKTVGWSAKPPSWVWTALGATMAGFVGFRLAATSEGSEPSQRSSSCRRSSVAAGRRSRRGSRRISSRRGSP